MSNYPPKAKMPKQQIPEYGNLDLRASKTVSLRRGVAVAWFRIAVFAILDAILISLSWKAAKVVVAIVPWFESVDFNLIRKTAEGPPFLPPILVVTLITLASSGLYGERESRRHFFKIVKSLTLAQVILVLIAYLYRPELFISRSTFLLAWLFSIIWVLTGRLVVEGVITSLRQEGKVRRKIALMGRPEDTERAELILKLVSKKEFQVMGRYDVLNSEDSDRWTQTLEEIYHTGVGEVFVCSWQSLGDPMQLYWSLKSIGVLLRILPIGLEIPHQSPKIEMIGGLPTIQFRPPALLGSDFWTKRIFDLVVAAGILIVLSPVYLLIAIAIKVDSTGPIFYKQTRVGLHGRHFKVWKFRTMVVNADQLLKQLEAQNEIKGGVLFKMKDDPRITKVGKFLRRYSLDELPQVINVILGQMSLVGPRPLPLRDVEGFAEHHFMRHNVLPGITGLWQVSGRSDIKDFEDAFKLDVAYINNWSLALDFQILVKTVKVVLGKEGAY
ncbi:sugar transferase [Oscillatoria salina]